MWIIDADGSPINMNHCRYAYIPSHGKSVCVRFRGESGLTAELGRYPTEGEAQRAMQMLNAVLDAATIEKHFDGLATKPPLGDVNAKQ